MTGREAPRASAGRPRPSSERARPQWTNRHTIGTPPSPTRAQIAANVTAEGGGNSSPTLMLGGGAGFSG